jgi:hypothetical protein
MAGSIRPVFVRSNVKHVTFVRGRRRYPCRGRGATPSIEDEAMKTRRMAFWWFRFVVSGRFLEKFLNLRRAERPEVIAFKREISPAD